MKLRKYLSGLVDALVHVVTVDSSAAMRFGKRAVPFGPAVRIALLDKDRHDICIEVILITVRAQSFDPSLVTVMGIGQKEKIILVIKPTNHFYAACSPPTAQVLYCSAGKPYPNDPAINAYRFVRTDIWPRIVDPFAGK